MTIKETANAMIVFEEDDDSWGNFNMPQMTPYYPEERADRQNTAIFQELLDIKRRIKKLEEKA